MINSNLGRKFRRFQDMTSFPLNLLPPPLFNQPPFENVPLALDG